MKILITGALGHVGSYLIRHLPTGIADEVILVDNLATQRYASLFDLPEGYNYRFIQADICEANLEDLFKDVDVVVHLAALTDAETSHLRPEEFEKVNLNGLKRVAEACLKTKTKLIFPSSTSLYGSQADLVDETCTELKPQSPYADSKLAAEKYLQELKNQGLEFAICRLGTIFGWSIGMRFHTAVNKFTWQAVNSLPLSVWKTAWQQKRPYLDLTDCVRAINFILDKDLFNGEIYNVLTSNLTVQDIVGTIKQFVPDLKIEFVDSPIMNQLSYDVDDSKLRKLGFAPQGDLKKGIQSTIEHFNSIIIENQNQ